MKKPNKDVPATTVRGHMGETDEKKPLSFHDYQSEAITTLIYPGSGEILGLSYVTLGLAGEAGEIAEKVKKIIRDKGGELSQVDRVELIKEVGDVLWYAAALCHELGGSLADTAQLNIDKLNSRKERGKLGGSGDNR